MEVLAALGHGGDEGDAEAAAPVAEEVGEGRGFIVLCRAELRIGDDGEGHEEEGVAEALQGPGPGVVGVVGLEIEVTVMDHGDADDHDRSEEQDARMDDAALH